MAGKSRKKKHKQKYIHGSAAAELQSEFDQLDEIISDSKQQKPANIAPLERPRTTTTIQNAPSVSLFAIIGFFAVASLMIFVMLAQVNLNEVMRETARLNSQLEILGEQRRMLSITFESVINMDEVERYARDVLGMSTPDAGQYTVMRALPPDRIEIFDPAESEDRFREIGSFLTFLFEEYIR